MCLYEYPIFYVGETGAVLLGLLFDFLLDD